MARKRIRELTNLASLGAGGYRIPLDPPSTGDAKSVLDTVLRSFMSSEVASDLADHIADSEAHNISSYVSSLLASADAATLLGTLGFELTGTASSGKFSFGGLFVVTWRDHTVAGSSSPTKAYGADHVYSSWARAWLEGDDFSGPENSIDVGVTAHGTSGATVQNGSSNTANIVLFSWGV